MSEALFARNMRAISPIFDPRFGLVQENPLSKTIGDYLFSLGCRKTIAFAMDRSICHGDWIPGLPIGDNPTPIEFAGRYTFRDDSLHTPADPAQAGVDQSLFTAGSLCGHDIPEQHRAEIQALCRRPDNPLGLENNAGYVVTGQDLLDWEYVKDVTEDKPVWLTVWPRLAAENVAGQPFKAGVPMIGGVVPTIPAAQNQAGARPIDPLAPALAAAYSAYFAKVWGGDGKGSGLRQAILSHHGVVGVQIRSAIFDAFLDLARAAAEVGLIADDGSIRGGEDE